MIAKPKSAKNSPIWNFYEVVDRYTAQCVICRGHFSYRSTVSNLKKHFARKHANVQLLNPAKPNNNFGINENTLLQSRTFHISTTQKKVSQEATPQHIEIQLVPTEETNTPTIDEDGISIPQLNLQHFAASKNLREDKKFIQNNRGRNINDALMHLFIKDFHPINIVEDVGFRNFITSLNPTCEVPSKKYISQTLLPAMYEKCLENARTISSTITSACVTTECWTSINDESFLTITAHFLNNDFYLMSVLLSCSLLEENFTSESLADELNHVVNNWDLHNKIIFSVSSGEDYIANAFNTILKWDHLGCFIHSLNKIIWDALSLKPIEELISKVRQVVSFFSNNPMASSELHLSQINCNNEPKKLKTDIPMMWNSTFYMIERLVELQSAISCTVTMQESNIPLIQPDEWTVLKELTKILKSLEAITKAADQENYMLASLPIVLANGLFEICRKLNSSKELSCTTRLFVEKLKNGFNAKFSDLKKNPILSVCTFLDPRFKTIPFGNNEGPVKKRVVDLITQKFGKGKQSGEARETASKTQNIEELSVWEMFDKTAANTKLDVSMNSRAQLEVDGFLNDDLINRNSDPLEWWRTHRHSYPHLSQVVLEIFCSLATSVPCYRMFTKVGNTLTDRRSKLSSYCVKQQAFLNANEYLLKN